MAVEQRACRFPVAGVFAAPTAASERHTEVVYGEVVRLLGAEDAGYHRVRVADTYEGWVAGGALGAPPVHRGSGEAGRVVVTALRASLGGNREASLGAVFVVQAEEMGGFRVALPDGEMGLLAQSDAQPAGAALRVAGGEAVVADARRFLGVPFLWGGVTWRGIDCSGLVQAVHRRFLRLLPRDADAQEAAGREVSGEEWRAGDLVCYGDHIAIATERGTIIHAYGRAGGVVETPHPNELRERVRCVRRVFDG
jgi:cell wall-associated NlpC family hydrolase